MNTNLKAFLIGVLLIVIAIWIFYAIDSAAKKKAVEQNFRGRGGRHHGGHRHWHGGRGWAGYGWPYPYYLGDLPNCPFGYMWHEESMRCLPM